MRGPYTAVKRISKVTWRGKGKILSAVDMDRLYPEKKNPNNKLINNFRLIHCVDQEQEALGYAKLLFEKINLAPLMIQQETGPVKLSEKTFNLKTEKPLIVLEHSKAIRLQTSEKYDLIWSSGLFDYLRDSLAIRMIKRMWFWLAEGGKIVFGNFQPNHANRIPMELYGGWYLIYRTPEDLAFIAVSAGIPKHKIKITSEKTGINLFCEIRK